LLLGPVALVAVAGQDRPDVAGEIDPIRGPRPARRYGTGEEERDANRGQSRPDHGATSGRAGSRRPRVGGRRQAGRSQALQGTRRSCPIQAWYPIGPSITDPAGTGLWLPAPGRAARLPASSIAGFIGVVRSRWFSRSDRAGGSSRARAVGRGVPDEDPRSPPRR